MKEKKLQRKVEEAKLMAVETKLSWLQGVIGFGIGISLLIALLVTVLDIVSPCHAD